MLQEWIPACPLGGFSLATICGNPSQLRDLPMTPLQDFPDFFSPMLVKELRQGLRARVFLGLFLGLQAFMAVMLLSAGTSGKAGSAGATISAMLFSFFAVAAIVVQPLRATSALSGEVKGNTLDLLALTRLSAWRIVFGKWIANVSQTALMLVAVLPYLVLRYFFGGMNLTGEVMLVLLLFLTSAALSAVTIGLSGCSAVLVRFILPVVGLPMVLWMLLVYLISTSIGGSGGMMGPVELCSLASEESRWAVGIYSVVMGYLGYTFLSWGTSMIAPAAENHALWRRFFSLLLLGAVALLKQIASLPTWVSVFLVCAIALPTLMTALTESSPWVVTVRRPFEKFGKGGRMLGWLFYPHRASGYLFAVVFGVLAMGVILDVADVFGSGRPSDYDDWTVVFGVFGGLYFPALLQSWIQNGEGQRVGGYLLGLAGSWVALGPLSAIYGVTGNSGFLFLFCWNPLVFIPLASDTHGMSGETLLSLAVLVDALILLALAGRALADIRKLPSGQLQPRPQA